MFSIGFTGTQHGMTRKQEGAVYDFIRLYTTLPWETHFHHGDCVGADRDFHEIILSIKNSLEADGLTIPYCIHVHPPIDPKKRAYCGWDVLHPEKDYMARNLDIVRASDVMLATPGEKKEVLRSGTWSTIRKARKLRKKTHIIFPDGEILTEVFN